MEVEIEIYLSREELTTELQVELLVRVAEQMARIAVRDPPAAILALLAAASVAAIRNAAPGMGVAPELKGWMVEATKLARSMTVPPPKT